MTTGKLVYAVEMQRRSALKSMILGIGSGSFALAAQQFNTSASLILLRIVAAKRFDD